MADIPYRSGRGYVVKLTGTGGNIWGNCRILEMNDPETFKGEVQGQDGVHVFADTYGPTKIGTFKFERPDDDTVPGALCTGNTVTVSYCRLGGTVFSATGHVIEEGGVRVDPSNKDGLIRSCTVALHTLFSVTGAVGAATNAPYRSPRGYSLALVDNTTSATILSLANWRQFTLPLVKTFSGDVQAGSGISVFGDTAGYTSFGEIPFEVADSDAIAGALLTGDELALTLTKTNQKTITGLGHLTMEGGAKADPSSNQGMIRRYNLAMHGLLTYT